MRIKYIPNLITIFRMMLIVPFVLSLMLGYYRFAFFTFLLAGISDGVDGYLARQFAWTSQFGAFFDPLADKLLMMSGFIVLAWLGKLPLLLFWIVVLRDVVIISGVGGVFYVRGDIEVDPSKISKINTALQVLLIACLLYEMAFVPLAKESILAVMIMVAFTSITSLIGYVYQGIKHAFFEQS